jgi:hypothetical protein
MPAYGHQSSFYRQPFVSVDDTALVVAMAAIADSFEAYGNLLNLLHHSGLRAALGCACRQRGVEL